jgi:hypothetical protein
MTSLTASRLELMGKSLSARAASVKGDTGVTFGYHRFVGCIGRGLRDEAF